MALTQLNFLILSSIFHLANRPGALHFLFLISLLPILSFHSAPFDADAVGFLRNLSEQPHLVHVVKGVVSEIFDTF